MTIVLLTLIAVGAVCGAIMAIGEYLAKDFWKG